MIQAEELIKVDVGSSGMQIHVSYRPQTIRTVFDICDMNGRILKTGSVLKLTTTIEVSDLRNSKYVLLILDGDRVCSQKFSLQR